MEGYVADYEVVVHTGNVDGAGTDANVSISLMGTKARTYEFNLDNLNRNDFERNATDRFTLRDVADIGDLRAIAIRQDMQGMYAAWFLELVVVKQLPDGPIHRFPCHRWLEGGTGDKCVGLILTEHAGGHCFATSNVSSESLGGDVWDWLEKHVGDIAKGIASGV
jgi:hypothetical protein